MSYPFYKNMEVYFSGKKLYGDDFSQEQICKWFVDESEGYFNLTQKSSAEYSYGYHSLNIRHGYSFLSTQHFGHILGVGSAYGDELIPIINGGCYQISILEPSDGFSKTEIGGVPVNYEKPSASGVMPFVSNSIDLITCFGILHHIPNVGSNSNYGIYQS